MDHCETLEESSKSAAYLSSQAGQEEAEVWVQVAASWSEESCWPGSGLADAAENVNGTFISANHGVSTVTAQVRTLGQYLFTDTGT